MIEQNINIITENNDEIIITDKGTKLKVPSGLSYMKYYNIVQEVLNLLKEKGLTIKQAQKVCIDTAEMLLDIDFN